jgi:HK97 family phage portal protein
MPSFLKTLIKNQAPPYVGRGVRAIGGLFGSNQEALLRTYGSVGTIFAIVDKLTEATASADWHLYRSAKPGQDRTEIFVHPAIDLWNKPNPHYDQHEFIETFQQHLDLVGEAIWYLGRSTTGLGPPLELWPIRPDRVTPVPDPDLFIAGWVYRCPGQPDMPWATEDVIQLKRPNPLDPYRGLGPVQAILTDIDSERYSAQWNRNFFINSAEPGGIIQVDRNLTDAEFEEMSMRWSEQHQGVAMAHRVAILEKATWIDRKFTQRDMQFEQMRHLNREIIREAFGFPKFMLGDTDTTNRATAEAAEVVFARWLIDPRLNRIKRALNEKLLPLYGTSGAGLEFDYDDPSPKDEAAAVQALLALATAAKTLIDAGYDPDAVLETVGLPPMKYAGKPAPTGGGFQAKALPKKVTENRFRRIFEDILDTELTHTLEQIDASDI